MYASPPAKSQSNPSPDKLVANGFMAKTITHPMNTYKSVEINLYFPVKKSFKSMPVIANPQEIPKIDQPIGPCSVTRVKGV